MNERSAVVNEKDQNQWLTEVDVSLLTKISLSTLRAHRFYRKGMPYSKVGRSVRYSLADVAAFMESRRGTIEKA